MKLYDIETTARDEKQGGLYDLIEPTFTSSPKANIKILTYTVTQDENMRIDLVSNAIYGTTDYADFLMNLNEITNALNIMQDDIIKYVDAASIDSFLLDGNTNKNVRKTLLNANKINTGDPNRAKYIENNQSVPPTFLDTPNQSVKINSGKIIIGGS